MPDEMTNRRMTLFNALETIQRVIVETYNDYEVELPSRIFFDTGGPNETPFDCEQVAISFEQMYNGIPNQPDQQVSNCYGPRTATFYIQVVRETPVMKREGRSTVLRPPTIDEYNAIVDIQTNDAWILMDAGLDAAKAVNGIGGLADVVMGQESGGLQATVLNLTLMLE